MMHLKKVLVISSSPRAKGNSELLCEAFVKGAQEAGNDVELIKLREKEIHYCLGCYACAKLGHCFQKDDMNAIALKMEEADVIVLATPVYFYSMSGQLKVMIDRMVQNYTKVRADIYIMVTAWDDNKENLLSTVEAIRGFSRDCLEECEEKGVIIAGGANQKGDIQKTPYIEEAYQMGLHC